VFTCRVLSLAVPAFRGDPAKDAGLIRHKNAVLRRHKEAAQAGTPVPSHKPARNVPASDGTSKPAKAAVATGRPAISITPGHTCAAAVAYRPGAVRAVRGCLPCWGG